jgi:hypothetical protein
MNFSNYKNKIDRGNPIQKDNQNFIGRFIAMLGAKNFGRIRHFKSPAHPHAGQVEPFNGLRCSNGW